MLGSAEAEWPYSYLDFFFIAFSNWSACLACDLDAFFKPFTTFLTVGLSTSPPFSSPVIPNLESSPAPPFLAVVPSPLVALFARPVFLPVDPVIFLFASCLSLLR